MKQVGLVSLLLIGMLVSGPVAANDLEQARADAREAAKALMTELGGELQAAMQSGGPTEAIDVCVERAPAITARLSRERGWRVSRVSDRYRNPLLGMPDDWEARTLDAFRERHADGEPYKGMSHSEVVDGAAGRRHRFMLAIPAQGLCMSCHGAREQLAPAIRETLSQRYPHDRATGYAVGDLRGAFSIAQPLE
ncbi:MAG: DUF3365 domain-containing protein [Halofilum sp. (in: g-proteobacteria)]|nr:DUF3365 domain-containing protein [Halofilum sp. (in: g-proteobacteria)]